MLWPYPSGDMGDAERTRFLVDSDAEFFSGRSVPDVQDVPGHVTRRSEVIRMPGGRVFSHVLLPFSVRSGKQLFEVAHISTGTTSLRFAI